MTKREANWYGPWMLRFRWTRMRREWGRYCYIGHPYAGLSDIWWEWKD